jgi:hypothetical protein
VRVRWFAYVGWLACLTAVLSSALWASDAAAQGPSVQPSLTLIVGHNPVVGRTVPVTATGTAASGYSVWIFVDPESTTCPPDPSYQPPGLAVIAPGVAVGESFSVSGLYQPDRTGQQSFCAYLWRSSTDPAVAAIEVRKVLRPPLPAEVARRMVEVGLKRHGFAERVVEALKAHCGRRGRTVFGCRFEARFRGYRLSGHGWVRQLDDEITYRFRVRAQGQRFVLTDHNEGDLP